MGISGVHSFENDDAREWCQAYREMGLPVAGSTIDVALGDFSQDNLSAGIACRAVAAVEAVAFALGRGSAEAEAAFGGAPDADPNAARALVAKCNDAIAAITGASGLAAFWKENRPADHGAWLASMHALQARLNGGDTAAPVEEVSEVRAPAPAQAPETSHAPVDADLQDQLADIRNAIGRIEADLEVMRQEVREGLIEIARRVARGSQ